MELLLAQKSLYNLFVDAKYIDFISLVYAKGFRASSGITISYQKNHKSEFDIDSMTLWINDDFRGNFVNIYDQKVFKKPECFLMYEFRILEALNELKEHYKKYIVTSNTDFKNIVEELFISVNIINYLISIGGKFLASTGFIIIFDANVQASYCRKYNTLTLDYGFNGTPRDLTQDFEGFEEYLEDKKEIHLSLRELKKEYESLTPKENSLEGWTEI